MSHVATIRVGDAEVSVVCYGFAPLDLSDECPGHDVDWDRERARHPWAFLDERTWPWHVHAFVARGPWGTALVDTGLGSYPPYRPWVEGTEVPASDAFGELGLDVHEVDLVVLTHLHADHAGGAWADEADAPRFPDARYVVHEADLTFFGDGHEPYAAVAEMRRLDDLGMLDPSPDDRELAPGIRVVHTPGHTPGHRSVVLEAGSATLLVTGDLLHLPVQVAHPSWASSHDDDPELGARSRAALLSAAMRGRWIVAVPHFASPYGAVDEAGWRSIGPVGPGAVGP
jgi:glyoxylase-like metal-dependent hydrolase (beta-lactamase superfamily II)